MIPTTTCNVGPADLRAVHTSKIPEVVTNEEKLSGDNRPRGSPDLSIRTPLEGEIHFVYAMGL
jgi:hypothetical protein